jgi:hypothetical protein
MFIGHYGASFAARAHEPRVSLGWFFLAVQFLDVLFGSFVLTGVEHMRIVPGFTEYNPYELYDMPLSHSLVAAVGWSLLAAIVALGLRQPRAVAALIALSVLSHFALDVPMHAADLPVFSEAGPKLGFGLWNHRLLSLLTEMAVAGAGLWLYWTKRQPAKRRFFPFAVTLLVLTVATPFLPPPPSAAVFALQALFAYVGLAFWAGYVDR